MGRLVPSGIGVPVERTSVKEEGDLWSSTCSHNTALLRGLREGEHSRWLLEATRDDARKGRMSWPTPIDSSVVESTLLHPRFVVAREKPDGSVKLRAVDHLSWSPDRFDDGDSVNGFTTVAEKLGHDTLDRLGEALTELVKSTAEVPGLFKADIDSAFRRIPISPEHYWAAGVVFVCDGVVSSPFLSSFFVSLVSSSGVCVAALCLHVWSG